MQTQCPDCNTVFRVSEPELNQADGLVRCGHCFYIFNGEEQLLPEPADKAHGFTADFFKRMLLNHPPRRSRRAIAGWATAIILAGVFLLGQLAYLKRGQLAGHDRIGPYIRDICRKIPTCALPPKRDLHQIQLVSRNVYSHPNIDNVLIVNAVITNSAGFEQPYPVLLISMSDIRGQVIAERYFRPREYLPEHTPADTSMEPGKSVPVSLAVIDPGNDAMAFELDFL